MNDLCPLSLVGGGELLTLLEQASCLEAAHARTSGRGTPFLRKSETPWSVDQLALQPKPSYERGSERVAHCFGNPNGP
jgi:hypothetical protein